MGTSSTLEIRYQGKTAFRYASNDGHPPDVMGALVASVATIGLDNVVRDGFLAQRSVNPEEGESEHVNAYNEVSPEAWAAARDAYVLCAQSRNRQLWQLAHLMLQGEEYAHGHPYMGALFSLAPEMSNDVVMAGKDFILDLDSGRVGACVATDRWLWIDLKRADYFDADVAYVGIQEWFDEEKNDELRDSLYHLEGGELEAALNEIQTSLDAKMASLEGVPPTSAPHNPKDDRPNTLAALQAMDFSGGVAASKKQLSRSELAADGVISLRDRPGSHNALTIRSKDAKTIIS